MTEKDIQIRKNLLNRHMTLVHRSAFEMDVARNILHFLNRGEISLGLSDVDFRTECELEEAGVNLRYSRNYNRAYARIGKKVKE